MVGTAHPYTGYNKKEIEECLVGNWVEERALKSGTGVFRYQPWVKDSTPGAVYPDQVDATKEISGMPTFPRVLEHSDRLEPSEWETHNYTAYRDPASRSDDMRVYSNPKKQGARTTAMLAKLKAIADIPEPEEKLPPQLTSTKQEAYTAKPIDRDNLGASVMKTQDGIPIPPSARDLTFRAELGMATKPFMESAILPSVDPAKYAGDFHLDPPVTVFSEKVSAGKLGTITGTTPAMHGNAFVRTSNFTKPISHYDKVVDNE